MFTKIYLKVIVFALTELRITRKLKQLTGKRIFSSP